MRSIRFVKSSKARRHPKTSQQVLRRHTGARHLFAHWPKIAWRVRTAKRVALFLDFDGTLVPFCSRPEEVRLGVATRRVLRALARHPRLNLVVVSGRRRAELIQHVDTPRVQYLGLYGWEGRKRPILSGQTVRSLATARGALTQSLAKLPGIRIEDKIFGFAVHYRGARRSAVRQARAVIREVIRRFEQDLRLLQGSKIWEVVPSEVEGKGEAVRDALRRMPGSSLPIYLGDDKIDEAAFAVLHRGITVHVGKDGRTKARYRLRSPAEVRVFLERLEAELS